MLIQPYQPMWSRDFETIRKVVDTALNHQNVSIEHIGSTAVPGLAAKPIIDIDIVFADDARFVELTSALATIGYQHVGNQGIIDRDVFKRGNSSAHHNVLDAIPHHLYVCPAHSEELRRHICFRNQLRANQDARTQYQFLKYQVAEQASQDRKEYARLKETALRGFINEIIDKAEKDTQAYAAFLPG